jgi:integrase
MVVLPPLPIRWMLVTVGLTGPLVAIAEISPVWKLQGSMESASLAPASINLRLSAIRKLATEAAENGLLDRSVAQGIVSLKGVRQSGDKAGNWLTREQARDLLAQPELDTMEGKRYRAILAVLLGCELRRSELAALESRHIQQRDGRWVFVDLVGKGKRIRTVPIPPFVKVAIDTWTAAAGLSGGSLASAGAPPRISGKDTYGAERTHDLAYRDQVRAANRTRR